MATSSPYASVPESEWVRKTEELVQTHPLRREELVEVVLASWDAIFTSRIGPKGFKIGEHLYPKPQIMGFLLHELITLEIESRYPGKWHGDKASDDKDLVYVPDQQFSVEIKTSSHPSQIFGNRSYAQESKSPKKLKSGYYLAVNFGKFGAAKPTISRIRFGWIDNSDWIGQTAATGQQAHLDPRIERAKLLTLYSGS